MIYTGYFSHQTKYISAGLVPISVAQYIPKKISESGIIEYKRLAPSRDMMELAKRDLGAFIVAYETKLSRMNRDMVIDELMALSEGADVVLLCYEKPENFCHRQIIAHWFGDVTEFHIECGKKHKVSENMEIEL